MIFLQIILTILAIAGFIYVLKHPVLYKPRQDGGDVVRFAFYGVIQLIILIVVIILIWTLL